jgi:hypothetical protein
MPGVHKNNTATFDELNDEEQIKSINMHIINLERMINAHEKRVISQGKASEKTKCVVNILTMVIRLLQSRSALSPKRRISVLKNRSSQPKGVTK